MKQNLGNQNEVIRRIADAIVESVKEAGEMGAPSGIVMSERSDNGSLDYLSDEQVERELYDI